MSGRRRVGSSCGRGWKIISAFEPVTAKHLAEHTPESVHSSGLPMLTGRCSASGQTQDAIDEIGDVAEAARLRAVAVDGERLAAQRLHHEVGDDAAVVGLETRAVGVEDADQVGIDAVVTVIGHDGASEKRLASS